MVEWVINSETCGGRWCRPSRLLQRLQGYDVGYHKWYPFGTLRVAASPIGIYEWLQYPTVHGRSPAGDCGGGWCWLPARSGGPVPVAGGVTMTDSSEYGISFISLPGMRSVEIVDPIERRRYRLDTADDVRPETIDPDGFRFPVDRAIGITTSAITLPTLEAVLIRKADGEMLSEVDHDSETRLPDGSYILDINAPIKVYLEFDGGLSIHPGNETITFTFDGEARVKVGARSAHDHPETTLQTTTDPVDQMETVSAFASALKTTSPERSFPAQRGHPPRVEVGDEVVIPDALEPPETGITLELEPASAAVFTGAPLSYYLGARMVPADRNAVVVDGSAVRDLGQDAALRENVEEVLKHVFTLDCITRTEGAYQIDLDERRRLEKRVDLDFAELYELSSDERLRRYLEVPHTYVSDLVPDWGMTAHVVDDPHHVELLPYLVEDLALVHVHQPGNLPEASSPSAIAGKAPTRAGAITRSTGATTTAREDFVKPPETGSVDQLWVGDGTPIGASKAIPEAFEHRLGREPTDADIDITVICNDQQMNRESNVLEKIYGSREDLSFNLSIHQNLTQESLKEALREDSDFLHYIGHIDDDGVECADGKLDIAVLDEVGTSAFLLNACQSYEQGENLIERGAIGGIVTLSEVINESAVEMGGTLARLLNAGFPMYAALDIAKEESLMGLRYIVVGDGRVALTQPKSIPQLYQIDSESESIEFTYATYPTERADLGSLAIPFIGDNDWYFLVSNSVDSIDPTKEELLSFLEVENMPTYLNGRFTWSSDVEEL